MSFEFQVSPIAVEGNADRWVTGLRCIEIAPASLMSRADEPPVPIDGSERVIPCDTVVVAVGTCFNPLLTSSSQNLALTERGYLAADEHGMTNLPGVFAGGDIAWLGHGDPGDGRRQAHRRRDRRLPTRDPPRTQWHLPVSVRSARRRAN